MFRIRDGCVVLPSCEGRHNSDALGCGGGWGLSVVGIPLGIRFVNVIFISILLRCTIDLKQVFSRG